MTSIVCIWSEPTVNGFKQSLSHKVQNLHKTLNFSITWHMPWWCPDRKGYAEQIETSKWDKKAWRLAKKLLNHSYGSWCSDATGWTTWHSICLYMKGLINIDIDFANANAAGSVKSTLKSIGWLFSVIWLDCNRKVGLGRWEGLSEDELTEINSILDECAWIEAIHLCVWLVGGMLLIESSVLLWFL